MVEFDDIKHNYDHVEHNYGKRKLNNAEQDTKRKIQLDRSCKRSLGQTTNSKNIIMLLDASIIMVDFKFFSDPQKAET